MPVVRQRHPGKDPFMQVGGHRQPTLVDDAAVPVPQAQVGVAAGFERADLGVELQRLRSSAGGRVQRAPPLA